MGHRGALLGGIELCQLLRVLRPPVHFPHEAPAQAPARLSSQRQELATMPIGLLICTKRPGFKKKNWKGAQGPTVGRKSRFPLGAVGPDVS